MDPVEAVQKVYLGVGKMLTADEARELVNRYGAGLPVPGPDFPTRATMEAPMGSHQTLIHKT